MSEINLLPQKQTGGREEKALAITRSLAIGTLLLVTVCSAALFFLNIQSPLPKLADEEKSLLRELSAYDKRTNTYAALNDRLNNISSLLAKRTSYSSQIDVLIRQAPSGVSITGVVLSEKENKNISFNVSAKSLAPLNVFIDNMTKLAQDPKAFKRVTLSDVSYDNTRGEYQVSILMTL